MAKDIVIPLDLWKTDGQTVISSWLFNDGANVQSGALVAEIMTDKTQFEIYAPASGVLRIIHGVDDVVSKGTVIGTIT